MKDEKERFCNMTPHEMRIISRVKPLLSSDRTALKQQLNGEKQNVGYYLLVVMASFVSSV